MYSLQAKTSSIRSESQFQYITMSVFADRPSQFKGTIWKSEANNKFKTDAHKTEKFAKKTRRHHKCARPLVESEVVCQMPACIAKIASWLGFYGWIGGTARNAGGGERTEFKIQISGINSGREFGAAAPIDSRDRPATAAPDKQLPLEAQITSGTGVGFSYWCMLL